MKKKILKSLLAFALSAFVVLGIKAPVLGAEMAPQGVEEEKYVVLLDYDNYTSFIASGGTVTFDNTNADLSWNPFDQWKPWFETGFIDEMETLVGNFVDMILDAGSYYWNGIYDTAGNEISDAAIANHDIVLVNLEPKIVWVDSMELTAPEKMQPNETATATVTLDAGQDKYPFRETPQIRFESSNPEVVSVDAKTGKLTAGSVEGTATITVYADEDLRAEEGLDEIVTASVEITVVAPKDQWKFDGKGWWYSYGKGGYPKNCWEQINQKWYWFDSEGYMVTGWKQISGSWYYFDASGVMTTGWKQVSGSWYYFDTSGAMTTGWKQVSGSWYYFNVSGIMVTGWKQVSGSWYYFDASGVMTTGWKQVSGSWYYFNTSGTMATGWRQVSGSWYYFDASGAMTTGWKQVSGSWYYFDASGAMVTGKVKISGRMNAFSGSGVWLGYV